MTKAPDDPLFDFSDLDSGTTPVEPIGGDERRERVARLARLLDERDVDAFLCESGATMEYLAGIDGGRSERMFALVVFRDGAVLWVTPAFELERMRELVSRGIGGELVGWEEHEYAYSPLASALRARGVERLAPEPQLRHFHVQGIADQLGPEAIVDGRELVRALRGVKSAAELVLLRRANELTVRAFEAVHPRVEPGLTADCVQRMLVAAQEALGLRRIWNLTLVGPEAAEPHGSTTETPLVRGDVLLIDTGGSLHGYQSDNTRTWCVGGEVPSEVRDVWEVVDRARRAAFDLMEPGIEAREIDRAAREVITSAGHGPGYATFTHRLGHGIGLEGHESPYFDGGDRTILEPGMTFSNEPGIYLRGRFGIRLENIVAITGEGAECFGGWQDGPESPLG